MIRLFLKKPRRVSPPEAKKSQIRFSERHVRDEKHISERKRASAASALQRSAKLAKKRTLLGQAKQGTKYHK